MYRPSIKSWFVFFFSFELQNCGLSGSSVSFLIRLLSILSNPSSLSYATIDGRVYIVCVCVCDCTFFFKPPNRLKRENTRQFETIVKIYMFLFFSTPLPSQQQTNSLWSIFFLYKYHSCSCVQEKYNVVICLSSIDFVLLVDGNVTIIVFLRTGTVPRVQVLGQ